MTRPTTASSACTAGYRPLTPRVADDFLEQTIQQPQQQHQHEHQHEQEIVYQPRQSRVSYRWFVILWIIAMLSASFHENIRIRLGGNDPYFNFFLFSQQTSAGYCAGHGHCVADQMKPYWTIHGLWPSNDTTWPQLCNRTAKFNITLLDPIRQDLDKYWPSMTGHNPVHFWTHEWQKHGSCAMAVSPVNGILNYFNSTLNLLREYNVTNILLDADIVPSLNRTYTVDDLQKALTTELRARANIVCMKVDGFPNPVLSEVRFCLSKTTLQPIDCKLKHEHCGDGAVYYIPLNTTNSLSQLDPWSQVLVKVFSFYVKNISPV